MKKTKKITVRLKTKSMYEVNANIFFDQKFNPSIYNMDGLMESLVIHHKNRDVKVGSASKFHKEKNGFRINGVINDTTIAIRKLIIDYIKGGEPLDISLMAPNGEFFKLHIFDIKKIFQSDNKKFLPMFRRS